MTRPNVNKRTLKARCRAKGISVAGLARRIGRSRPVIYFALERPSRYPEAYRLILEALNDQS